MKTVRITAKTIDEAVEEGIQKLGISREQAIIHVVSQPSSGLFRLIHKKMAVVDVSCPEEKEASESRPPIIGAPAEMEESADKEEPAVKDVPAEPAEAEPEAAKTEEPEDKEEAPQRLFDEKPEEEEDHPFDPEEQKETADIAADFLNKVFHGMHMEQVTIEKFMTPERIRFNLTGEGMGILIGRHGQTLDALQYLTNLAAGKKYHHHYFVLLDVEDYRLRRQETLESLAKRVAGKVKRTGRSEKLEPMNAADRRIIHLALQDDPSITTESEGEVPYRSVVISLKDQPKEQ